MLIALHASLFSKKMRLIAIAAVGILLCLATVAGAETSRASEQPQTGRWAVIKTNKGTIDIALYEKDAPITTQNFIDLAQRKFYDGLTFHRVVPGFVIQGGDPTGTGRGGSGKTIKLEISPKLKFDAAGIVGMARAADPNSASSQFYITLAPLPFLDGKYAVFGRVTKGMSVVRKIQVGDVMESVRIIPAPTSKKPDRTTKNEKKSEKK